MACGLSSLTLRKGLPCLRQRFFSVFNRFQKQRFGIFPAAVSNGLGTISLFFVGSNSDVSGFFRLQLSHGLGTKLAGVLLFRMRVPSAFFMGFVWWLAGFQVLRCAKVCFAVSHGLGTKPAGVLLFRMRVPNTFFLTLAWWLAGFQVLRCAKVCLA